MFFVSLQYCRDIVASIKQREVEALLDEVIPAGHDIGLVIIDPPAVGSPWLPLPSDGLEVLMQALQSKLGTQTWPWSVVAWVPSNANDIKLDTAKDRVIQFEIGPVSVGNLIASNVI